MITSLLMRFPLTRRDLSRKAARFERSSRRKSEIQRSVKPAEANFNRSWEQISDEGDRVGAIKVSDIEYAIHQEAVNEI